MNADIQKILEIAVQAPSGDNSQPWKFRVSGNIVSVFNVPGADNPVYNFRQRGSYIAHGALLENIRIAASEFGYDYALSTFPDATDKSHVADVTLVQLPSGKRVDALFPFITQRCTNRKPYDAKPIPGEAKDEIARSASGFGGGELKWLEDRGKIETLAKTLSLNERLILENRAVHDYLFSFIHWTQEEELKTRTGMYVKTLELATPQEKAFKLFRKWGVVSFLNRLFKVSKLVSRDSQKLYNTSSAFLLILVPSEINEDFILAGRILQRVWLTVAKLGLSLQPTAALLYLAQRIHAGEGGMFSDRQQKDILEAAGRIRDLFGVTVGIPAMLVRIGRGGTPTARSVKKAPEIFEK